MVLFDPERRWTTQGVCRPEDEPIFFPRSGQLNKTPPKKTQALWDQAKEICAMCPVLAECRRDTLGEEFGVFGGLDEHERYHLRRRLRERARKWPAEVRLGWGAILAQMREDGLMAPQITRRTGIGFMLADDLVQEWEASRQEPEQAPVVVSLPEPGHRSDMPFPDRPGRCHAWIRHNGMISDAWYKGQTPDGAWIFVQTWAGPRRSVNKWIPARDVRLYQPQQVIIKNYAGRPDAPAA